jgi:sugar diacid utilization regulator
VRDEEYGNILAQKLWIVEDEGHFLAKTLRKVREEVEVDFVAQTLWKLEEEGDFLAQTLRKVREDEGDLLA